MVGRAVGGERQCGLRGGVEVGGDLGRVVGPVLLVLVEGRLPRHFLRLQVDLDLAAELLDCGQDGSGDLADRPVRSERDPVLAAVAVLDGGLMGSEVERDREGAGAVRGRQRKGCPSARREPKRPVLELGRGRRGGDRDLPEHLRVAVERIERLAPGLVGKRRPCAHAPTLPVRPPRTRSSRARDQAT